MAIYIGIDPGDHTGFAVWNSTSGKLLEVRTLQLWFALEEVRRWHYTCLAQQTELYVLFEDARLRKWFEKEKNASEYRGKLMGAGAAKRDAKIWEQFLTAQHITFRAIKPAPGRTKWKEDYWKHITGWQGRTSEHARDASLLVWGR